ncbi:MAG: hypothetical protein M1297_01230 [Nitrospirae bacterium]|nr:hypothetical protein [Nitrospirota bacterium]
MFGTGAGLLGLRALRRRKVRITGA